MTTMRAITVLFLAETIIGQPGRFVAFQLVEGFEVTSKASFPTNDISLRATECQAIVCILSTIG
jgi:hypothetical protein